MHFVRIAQETPLNTVAWIHDISRQPMKVEPDAPLEFRLTKITPYVRVAVGSSIVAATCNTFGARAIRHRAWTPAGTDEPQVYPEGWVSVHAPEHLGDQLLHIVEAVRVGIMGIYPQALSPDTNPPVLYLPEGRVPDGQLWVPEPIIRHFD